MSIRLDLPVWSGGMPAGMVGCRTGYHLRVRFEGLGRVCFEFELIKICFLLLV